MHSLRAFRVGSLRGQNDNRVLRVFSNLNKRNPRSESKMSA